MRFWDSKDRKFNNGVKDMKKVLKILTIFLTASTIYLVAQSTILANSLDTLPTTLPQDSTNSATSIPESLKIVEELKLEVPKNHEIPIMMSR